MSKSQIKRLHQQHELEKAANVEDDEEPVQVQRKGPANRFAFFDDEGSEDNGDLSDEGNVDVAGSSSTIQESKKKTKKNNKRKGKKVAEEPKETENQMLARLAALNLKEAKKAANELNCPSLEELMKIDMKMFDMSAEIKRKLGKAFKEAVTPGQNDELRWPTGRKATGRIVKNKPRWFPDKDYGLSMVQVKEEGGAIWFSIRHNHQYESRERMFWLAEREMNIGVVQELFADTPFHLNSILMLAHMNRMNEDFNTGSDLIERGIWYVDQHSAPTFEPFNWRHRMDYLDYENRVFYLLLHRHMLNAAQKRCWETAWNTGKLIFKLDPTKDPLAVMSIIDVFALKAKQYNWVVNTYEAAKKFKKLHLLPNWPYSVALAQFFLAKTDEDKEQAEKDLCTAIRHFPSVVVKIMDILQIHPDSAVMNCKMLTSFVADNEKESLKLLVKVYGKQTEEIWKATETLLFLERATQKVAMSTDPKEKEECDEWRERRNKMYHGRSPNVDRFGQLLEEIPGLSLSDPVPPQNGRCAYSKEGGANIARHILDDSFLGGFINSLLPHFDGGRTFQEELNRYGGDFIRFVGNRFNGAEQGINEARAFVNGWMQRRQEIDARAAERGEEPGRVIPLDDFDVPLPAEGELFAELHEPLPEDHEDQPWED